MSTAEEQRGSVRTDEPRRRRFWRFMDWPLRAKMAALLVMASLLPLAIETFVNIREARERLLANTAALLAARGDHLADRVDTFHRGYTRSAGRISRLPNAAPLCQARPEKVDHFKGSLRGILEVWPASDANIRGVAILDLSGTVRVATEEALIGLDLSYHGHVREALRGATITSDIYLAELQVAFEPTIAYLDPVRGTDGKIAGTSVLWVRASALGDVMRASNELAGADSFAVLFDRQGIRIGHTFSEDIVFHPAGRLEAATVEALVAERRFGERTQALLEDVRPFPEQFDRARAEAPDRGLFRGFAPVNQRWNYGVARRFETVPWTVFYMVPEQALNAQIAQMTRQKILFAGVIILIALAAATLFAAAILKPIDSLATATQSLADGHLAARVEAGHADELGRLGANFNSMAARIEGQATALQKGRDELDLRVQERTAELAQTNRNLEVEITERKQAEAARRESEDQFRTMANSIPQLACMARADGFIFWYNQRWYDYTGTTPEQMEGWGWQSVHEPEVLPKVMERWREAIATGQPFEMDFPLRGADGRFRMFLTRVQPLKDSQGRVVQWFGTNTDVDELKRMEVSLRDTQARLNSTLAAGSIGTWTWDIVHDCLIADEFTARMFSIEPASAAKGLPAEAYLWAVMEEDQPGVKDGLARAIQSCGYYDIEYRVRLKEGGFRWLQAKGRVEGDGAGKAVSFHGAVMDITDRKLADATLREVEKEKQLAFEASRLKSEFLANMSHELRTPLNGILGFTEFLVDEKPGPLNPKQKEYLTDVHNSAQHLLQLINDVLDLARVEAGKVELHPEKFSLAKAIEEVCAVVKGGAHQKGVNITWSVAPELGCVMLDQQKFKQVCYNLVANGVKFTDSGGSVEIKTLERGTDCFEIRVKDTGIGIKKEDLQRLFREFEQLETGSSRRFEGTGLGLALTKKLVELQGGSIGVESVYGQGSTFTVVLPLSSQEITK